MLHVLLQKLYQLIVQLFADKVGARDSTLCGGSVCGLWPRGGAIIVDMAESRKSKICFEKLVCACDGDVRIEFNPLFERKALVEVRNHARDANLKLWPDIFKTRFLCHFFFFLLLRPFKERRYNEGSLKLKRGNRKALLC